MDYEKTTLWLDYHFVLSTSVRKRNFFHIPRGSISTPCKQVPSPQKSTPTSSVSATPSATLDISLGLSKWASMETLYSMGVPSPSFRTTCQSRRSCCTNPGCKRFATPQQIFPAVIPRTRRCLCSRCSVARRPQHPQHFIIAARL